MRSVLIIVVFSALQLYPHRTVFLDPQVNNISPSKTQTELKKKMRLFSCPHPSYDIVSHLHRTFFLSISWELLCTNDFRVNLTHIPSLCLYPIDVRAQGW